MHMHAAETNIFWDQSASWVLKWIVGTPCRSAAMVKIKRAAAPPVPAADDFGEQLKRAAAHLAVLRKAPTGEKVAVYQSLPSSQKYSLFGSWSDCLVHHTRL